MSGFGFGSGSGSGSDVVMSFSLPTPVMIDEESPTVIEKQGIVSILSCNGERAKAASLRRTLSADMSSKKWLSQNGFSPIKKVASSEHLSVMAVDLSSSSSDGEDEKRQSQADVWSLILSRKADEDLSKLPPPYVHPLVKRASSLSEKSLEVCTESLGSETGSEVFSYPSSESEDVEEEKEEVTVIVPPILPAVPPLQQQAFHADAEETLVVKNNHSINKKVQPRSFPPPLPSLARTDGPSLHMHSRRENGRLVLEAVSVPSHNFFHAQRQDGRLLLTLLPDENSEDSTTKPHTDLKKENLGENEEDVFDIFDEKEQKIEGDTSDDDEGDNEDDDYNSEEEEEFGENREMEDENRIVKSPSRVINAHRLALSMRKVIGFENLNPTWSHKFNKGTKLMKVEKLENGDVVMAMEKQQPARLPNSLPPLAPRLTPSPTEAAASFNAYEYFWRAKSDASVGKPADAKPFSPLNRNTNETITPINCTQKAYEQHDMVLLKANKASVPSLRGCKEPRRSLLPWEPYCIATS